jgi:hypothetical protein
MSGILPVHSVEYELTSEFAAEVRRMLLRWELRRSWRRDLPVFAGALFFGALISWLTLGGWLLPVVGGGLLCLVMLFVIGALFRRWSVANGAAMMALLALHTTDRRVRIEFADDRIRMETEFFRGEGAWTELEEVVVFSNCWLLYLENGGQVLVPAKLMSPELEAFIRGKAEEVAAPVHQGSS